MKMSKKNEKDYLYLIWKAEKNGKRYIVGQLAKNGEYEFRYYEKEIREAIKEGFEPFFALESWTKYIQIRCFFLFLQVACRIENEKTLIKFCKNTG